MDQELLDKLSIAYGRGWSFTRISDGRYVAFWGDDKDGKEECYLQSGKCNGDIRLKRSDIEFVVEELVNPNTMNIEWGFYLKERADIICQLLD